MSYYLAHMWIARVFVVMGLSCFVNAQTDQFAESIKHVKQSIIPVACATWPSEDGTITIKQIYGTGFFVNYEGNFITAAHVINDNFKWYSQERPSADCFPVIYIPNPTWSNARWFQFHQCISDAGIDVAVCKTLQNPLDTRELHARWLHLSSKEILDDGTPVAFTGFPQNILVPITSRANIAAIDDLFVPRHSDIAVDKTVWHGVSGGPLYLSDGTVIGIIRGTGEGLWSGLAFARGIAEILRFLSEHHVIVAEDLPAEKK